MHGNPFHPCGKLKRIQKNPCGIMFRKDFFKYQLDTKCEACLSRSQSTWVLPDLHPNIAQERLKALLIDGKCPHIPDGCQGCITRLFADQRHLTHILTGFAPGKLNFLLISGGRTTRHSSGKQQKHHSSDHTLFQPGHDLQNCFTSSSNGGYLFDVHWIRLAKSGTRSKNKIRSIKRELAIFSIFISPSL